MAISIVQALAWARYLYINKESPDALAKEYSITPKLLRANIRLAIPTLISEEGWTIPEVLKHMGGRELPLEMRKEVQKLVKQHGLMKAIRLTTASMGSAARWGRGDLGKAGVLRMGNLPWKSLMPDSISTDTVKPSDSKNAINTGKRGKNSKASYADQRRAVYRMVTERPDVAALANEYGVTTTSIYSWRMSLVGKVGTKQYKAKCAAFIAEVAADAGEEPKPLVVRRAHQQTKTKGIKRRRRYSESFKRDIVNRHENQGESLADLRISSGVEESSVYSWRAKILGRKGSPGFTAKARELAREFIDEAKVDDVVKSNERDPKLQQVHPSANIFSYEQQPEPQPEPQMQLELQPQESSPLRSFPPEAIEVVASTQPNAILTLIEQIDFQIRELQIKRLMAVKDLELQVLRRKVAHLESSS